MTTCRRQKGNAFLFLLSMTANKVPSGSTDPKAGMAACFAMTSSAYNGTLAQPQPPATGDHAMGATRRDPRGSEILGVRRPPQFSCTPRPGEVVSNTGNQPMIKGQKAALGFESTCALLTFGCGLLFPLIAKIWESMRVSTCFFQVCLPYPLFFPHVLLYFS